MDCPILEVVQNHSTEEFLHFLKKYGKCSDFLEENAQKRDRKDAIFVGSVHAVHKPKINKRENRTQCIIILKLSNLIKGPHEHSLFRVVFIGRVVKDVVHLQKGDLIGILNPKLFFVMSSDIKIPSLTVGPYNVVLWICRNKLIDKEAKAVNTEVTAVSNSSDENESCLSASVFKANKSYKGAPVNYKEINKPKPQTSCSLSHLSNQSHSSRQNVKSFSKNSRVNNLLNNNFPSENIAQDGSMINSKSCINSVNPCHAVNQKNSSMPICTRNNQSGQLSPQCNSQRAINSCSHNNSYSCCFNSLSNGAHNPSCCHQASGHCRNVNPCYPKPLCCHQFMHNSHSHCQQFSCICNHSGCNYDRGNSHSLSRLYFPQAHKETASSSMTNKPSKTCCCTGPCISCRRPVICSHTMTHSCSRHSNDLSFHKSPCNWKESFCLPENTCHAVSSKCCCNCTWNKHCKCLRNRTSGVQSLHNSEALDDQDMSRSSLNKESIIRTQDWVRMWQRPDINIAENCEPICIESSSCSSASSHSMQAQNIIKPALNLTSLNNKSLADCSLNIEPKLNVKKKRKLFNPANNSIVIEEKSPETVIEESTPFNSEQSAQNPLSLSKISCKLTSLENQISTTAFDQNNGQTLINLDESSNETDMCEGNSQNCELLATKENYNKKKKKNFPGDEKNVRENQEATICSATDKDTVINSELNSLPALSLQIPQVPSINNLNFNKCDETKEISSFQLTLKDLKNKQTIISDESNVLNPLRLVNILKKRKDVPSTYEKNSDEIELFSEENLNKSKRLKSGDDSLVRSESPKSDKSNETVDLDNETTKLFSPSKNPEKHYIEADKTSKLGESITEVSSTSCGQSFHDALSTQSSKPDSQEQWIIKPIKEAAQYLSAAEKLYE